MKTTTEPRTVTLSNGVTVLATGRYDEARRFLTRGRAEAAAIRANYRFPLRFLATSYQPNAGGRWYVRIDSIQPAIEAKPAWNFGLGAGVPLSRKPLSDAPPKTTHLADGTIVLARIDGSPRRFLTRGAAEAAAINLNSKYPRFEYRRYEPNPAGLNYVAVTWSDGVPIA